MARFKKLSREARHRIWDKPEKDAPEFWMSWEDVVKTQ